ncbi:MAG TPA: hypothetical protein VEB68_07080 [Croceibacterium sp.]|nr:hypothetical protein [Croceibacterium sp.]
MTRLAGLAIPAALLWSTAAAGQAEAPRCQPDLARVAAWEGVWMAEGVQAGLNGRDIPGAPPIFLGLKLLGIHAPWNEAGWERLQEGMGRVAGNTGGHGFSFPLVMSAPSPFTIVVSPTKTVVIGEYREVRYIFTDGRPHLPEDERWPTLWGDSIGCWEGDTLVIDTVSVEYSPDYSTDGPPLSENAHFIERLHMTGPDRLESDITITDPETLERPWVVHMVYLRHPVIDRLVHEGDVSLNNRIVLENGLPTIAALDEVAPVVPLPPSLKLAAAELDRVAGKYALEHAPIEFTFERRGERLFMRVDPPQPFFMPVRAADPLNYVSVTPIGNGTFRFELDDAGNVTGFRGTSPEGLPMTARRKSEQVAGVN